VGPQESGTRGIKVKVGSGLEQKLMLLAESAKRKAPDPQHRKYLDQFMKALQTREFDWTDFQQ
jgi:hypothetical protein